MPKQPFNRNQKGKPSEREYRVNEDIHWRGNVRIVGEGIESKVVPVEEAKQLAEDMELDLIEINPAVNPPVMKIANFSKMMYEQKKADKKKNGGKPMKEIQLKVNIAENDMKTKANHARKFVEEGSRVKVVLSMRGRELARREQNKATILRFIEMVSDVATAESMPKDEGNRCVVFLKQKK